MPGFRNADGTPGGLVGTFIDISQQKEAARELGDGPKGAGTRPAPTSSGMPCRAT
jgi:hypothetical protein